MHSPMPTPLSLALARLADKSRCHFQGVGTLWYFFLRGSGQGKTNLNEETLAEKGCLIFVVCVDICKTGKTSA